MSNYYFSVVQIFKKVGMKRKIVTNLKGEINGHKKEGSTKMKVNIFYDEENVSEGDGAFVLK